MAGAPRAALAWALLVSIPLVQDRLDDRPPLQAREEALFTWRGEEVGRLVPGFEGIVADIYWLRVVQHYGSQRAFNEGRDYALLEPLLDITVTLDPRMEIAYAYGAIFLAEQPPAGAGSPQGGAALLERGIRALPDRWRLRQWLGFLQYSYLNDPLAAARTLQDAAAVEGAPYWLGTLAADMLARGCDRQTARAVWQAMASDSAGAVAQNAQVHLQVLDGLDGADHLSALVTRIFEKTGRRPGSLEDLGRALGLGEAPRDPSGTPYAYDPATGRVEISRASRLHRPESRSCVTPESRTEVP